MVFLQPEPNILPIHSFHFWRGEKFNHRVDGWSDQHANGNQRIFDNGKVENDEKSKNEGHFHNEIEKLAIKCDNVSLFPLN